MDYNPVGRRICDEDGIFLLHIHKPMKNVSFVFVALMAAASADAESGIITLDLTKSTTPLEFNAENGSWAGTYDDDAERIDSQIFSFVHSSMADWNTWWGFTVSNHADNSCPDNPFAQQWSNMARGGILLDVNGEVKQDASGAPAVSAEVPYLVAFYSFMMGERPIDMSFTDGGIYEVIGVYVNLTSFPYYTIECGDSFTRAFSNGDRFTLTIHGVAPDETEKSVDVDLASYTNGDLTINRGWKYVDLSSLGEVNELFFTMSSTDSGIYGMNTPAYFCLDKLSVKPVESDSGINGVQDNRTVISYDRNSRSISLKGNDFAVVYDVAGKQVMTIDGISGSVSALPAGVYVAKSGNSSLKFVK